jgi:hypothetical protein
MNSMNKIIPALILCFLTSTVAGSNDIWQNLFKEKLQEATQGNNNAQYDVGSMYQNGRGVKANRSKAVEWYEKAAAQANKQSISRLGLMRANEDRFVKTLSRAEKGDPESQYMLGDMYTKGVGVGTDSSQAIEWYGKSASQRYAKAEYNLGLIYYDGIGTRKNNATALEWFTRAAEQNHAAAQYYLGKMYAGGQGTKINYNTALLWYGKAADGGFDHAHGEMIGVAEKINVKSPAAKEPVKNTKKTRSSSTTTAKKPSKKTAKNKIAKTIKAKPGASSKEQSFSLEDLMLATWKREDSPVSYLPSSVNNCRTQGDELTCFSDDLTREVAGGTIKFKTKSIISNFTSDGSFDVTYRNLVINTTEVVSLDEGDDEEDVGSSDNASSAYTVKSGWGKPHTLECQMKNSGTVSCLKNKTHAFLLVSPQTLAAGN